MKLPSKLALVTLILLSVSACIGRLPIDQIPEYGGMDRNSVPEIQAADKWFIESTTKEFGSREKASKAFSEQGMKFYKQDNLETAMKRFNQAWLLDKNNYEAYWGFGVVMADKFMHQEALKWLEKAYAHKEDIPDLNADLAFMYAAVAVSPNRKPSEKMFFFRQSDNKFTKFESSNNNEPYFYYMWARALAIQEKYKESLSMFEKYKRLGGTDIDTVDFERELRKRASASQ